METMRLDQWLWAVRLFKSRSLATQAIRGGRVKVDEAATKPAHEVKAGEVVTVSLEGISRTLRVVDAPPSRVGAKLVALYAEEITSSEEFEKLRSMWRMPGARAPGTGRPTKRERRELDAMDST
jgi:ribosome-associated heat shock protein Hsp15